jgi:hydrogenase maturation factor
MSKINESEAQATIKALQAMDQVYTDELKMLLESQID